MTDTWTRSDVEVISHEYLDEQLTTTVVDRLSDRQPLEVLDAGCGRMWAWDLGDLDYRLTGIDADADALGLRQEMLGDLHAAIADDLRTVGLDPEAYDLVHSAYVLEHVDGAVQVLDQMAAALSPGGLMVVKIPDRHSVYGWVTRYTPYRAHVWYKRLIRRRSLAGTPGHGPYPVAYDDVIGLDGLTAWAQDQGLHLISAYGSNAHLSFFGRLSRAVDAGLRLIALASLGRLTARYANIAVVLVKPQLARVIEY